MRPDGNATVCTGEVGSRGGSTTVCTGGSGSRRIGVTSLVVSHDRDLAFGVADRIAVIAEGKILTIGTPEAVKKFDNPLVQEFLRADFKRENGGPGGLQNRTKV